MNDVWMNHDESRWWFVVWTELQPQELCHLYSRADKTVSYPAPAYYADHLCERTKLYLETLYKSDIGDSDSTSTERIVQEATHDIRPRLFKHNGSFCHGSRATAAES